MTRYVFSKGKVTVEEGVYTPLLPGTKPSRYGVLIFAESSDQNKPEETT